MVSVSPGQRLILLPKESSPLVLDDDFVLGLLVFYRLNEACFLNKSYGSEIPGDVIL
jgi:hypothetical protein